MGHTFGKAHAGDIDRHTFLQASVAVATIAAMKRGNERFRMGKEKPHHYLAQQQASATGQYL